MNWEQMIKPRTDISSKDDEAEERGSSSSSSSNSRYSDGRRACDDDGMMLSYCWWSQAPEDEDAGSRDKLGEVRAAVYPASQWWCSEQATVLTLQCTLTVTVSIGQSICQVLAYRSQPSLSLKWSLVSSSYLLVLEVLCAIVNCSTLFANKVNRIQQFENSDALYL